MIWRSTVNRIGSEPLRSLARAAYRQITNVNTPRITILNQQTKSAIRKVMNATSTADT
jgi:hypothetical protein